MTDIHNPLPKADRYSQSQRRSILSFQKVLPAELFVFRDERVDDAGVDGSLEILIDGCYTNMRAQVQLKSSQKKNAKQDGIVMLAGIETSNFNYLLNGQLGLYVLYVEETDELFYVWAADENRRRIKMDSDWKSKKEISIPLQELNELAIYSIYERIRREAELRREILEALAHAPTNDNISVSINPESLKSNNSVEIEKVLGSSGMTLVAAGYSNLVIEKLNLVSQKASVEPRFKLISAYANYSTGRYQLALGAVADAMISNELKTEDRRFAEKIHLACQTNLGMITSEQYFQEMEAKATDDELLDAEIKLHKLIDRFRSQMERDEEVLYQIKELKRKIITSANSPYNLKLGVRVKYLEIIGFDAIREILSEIFKANARKDSRIIVPLIDQIYDCKKAFNRFEEYYEEATSLIQDAINIGHPIFLADALSTKGFISLMVLISKIAFMEFEGSYIDQSTIQKDTLLILDCCEKAQKIYKQANMIEGEVRIQLIMAQAFEVMGQIESARNLAQGVFGKAKFLGYKRHIETANEICSGKSFFSKHIQNLREMLRQKKSDKYDPSALETEEDIQHSANFLMATYKIPEDRRKYVVKDLLCIRDNTREKNHWCRHIEIQQDLTHSSSPTTLYAEDPNRRVVCSKFDCFVDKLSPEWIDLIKEFKEINCSNCLDREPAKVTTDRES
ncbi:DUF4365 domain-containing protein [Phormidium sp. LEGE 05292]|uniref:DUF4365 domain-containing protein n=1 Tax=[Phormidium] sp. LEGE 05292 TaxID=767427 RepID=UPI00187E7782|nr:DUF4365 domain-containing protein [Phormidium sp. LEGE 05292]MBE9226444.1 DUF4365 domain-containing protein [Phormidium sp. LEGE 05292]